MPKKFGHGATKAVRVRIKKTACAAGLTAAVVYLIAGLVAMASPKIVAKGLALMRVVSYSSGKIVAPSAGKVLAGIVASFVVVAVIVGIFIVLYRKCRRCC